MGQRKITIIYFGRWLGLDRPPPIWNLTGEPKRKDRPNENWMDTRTINAIATVHKAAHESNADELLCNKSLFAFLREYMPLKIPEMACSALTHMAVLFCRHRCSRTRIPEISTAATNNGTSTLDATRTETKWTNAGHGSFLYPILVALAESTRLRSVN